MLDALQHWIENRSNLYLEREEMISRIVDLIEKNGDQIILLTYPLPYKMANKSLRKIARTKNLDLVDLESIFSEKMKNSSGGAHLIDDWEHCTPAGYKVMAEEISKVVLKLIQKER